MTYILASLGIISAWLVYRNNIESKRKNYIVALEKLLDTVAYWFDTKYGENFEDTRWHNPDLIIDKVDVGIIKSIITETGSIFSESLIKKLVQFVQLSSRFNQYVDLHLAFIVSNYVKLKGEQKNKECLDKMWGLAKHIHTRGIGDGYHPGSSDFPFLSQCFKDLKSEILEEKLRITTPLHWKGFIFGDFVFIVIPIVVIIISSYSYLAKIINLIIVKTCF